MLNKIIDALQEHKTVYEQASKVWESVKKDLNENYKGALYTQKLGEAKNVYEDTLQTSRENNYSACVMVLDGIRAKAQDIVTQPVSPDFPATVAALAAMKNPTRTEVEAIAARYKGNYLAYRAICDALGGAEKGFTVATVDDVNARCDELEAILHKCFYGGNPELYSYRLLLEGSYLKTFDDFFTAFIDGRFEDATQKDGTTRTKADTVQIM